LSTDIERVSSAYVPLAATDRSGHPESVHHGAVVALGSDGQVAFSLGDVDAAIFPRSSMKPIQALSMVRHGLDLPDELLALVCASHDGRSEHQDGVRRILDTFGLDERSLANTTDLPLDEEEARSATRAGKEPSSLQHNCSGKHAGMLATCVTAGWTTDSSYLSPDHPLQRAITEDVPLASGGATPACGVDGCGAPAHLLSVVELARSFRRIATGEVGSAGQRIQRAMSSHPEMVGGPTRDVTLLMRGVPGLMAKDGAEGVFAVALPDGRAVALKVADGANRARPPIMKAALTALGIDLSKVDERAFEAAILGHGQRVGEVRIVGDLAALVR
jgi:L-asparaginase II